MGSAFQKWREALQLAPNEKAVRGIVRSYVDEIRPLLGVLPPDCREMLAAQDIDIQAAAVGLLQAELRFTGTDEMREFLHELAYTFASASVRITLLHEVMPAANSSRYGRDPDGGIHAEA